MSLDIIWDIFPVFKDQISSLHFFTTRESMLSGRKKFSFLSFNFCCERQVVQTLDTISANAGWTEGDNISTSTKSCVKTFKTDFVDRFPLSEDDIDTNLTILLSKSVSASLWLDTVMSSSPAWTLILSRSTSRLCWTPQPEEVSCCVL